MNRQVHHICYAYASEALMHTEDSYKSQQKHQSGKEWIQHGCSAMGQAELL